MFCGGDGGKDDAKHLTLGKAYRTRMTCYDFLYFLSKVIYLDICQRLAREPTSDDRYLPFGVITDESTDRRREQGLII